MKRLRDNPFYVLGVPPDADRATVEREGQKLLGLLELGSRKATVYWSPVGEQVRTPEKVRAALAELRDPDKRLVHEVWATLAPGEPLEEAPVPEPGFDALKVLGWR